MIAKTVFTAAPSPARSPPLSPLATAAKAGPAPAQPGADKCYGVALAGKNDCAAGAGTILRGHLDRRLRSRHPGNTSPRAPAKA